MINFSLKWTYAFAMYIWSFSCSIYFAGGYGSLRSKYNWSFLKVSQVKKAWKFLSPVSFTFAKLVEKRFCYVKESFHEVAAGLIICMMMIIWKHLFKIVTVSLDYKDLIRSSFKKINFSFINIFCTKRVIQQIQ